MEKLEYGLGSVLPKFANRPAASLRSSPCEREPLPVDLSMEHNLSLQFTRSVYIFSGIELKEKMLLKVSGHTTTLALIALWALASGML